MLEDKNRIYNILKYKYFDLNKRIANLRKSVGYDNELLAYMVVDKNKCLPERMLAAAAMEP